MTRPAHVFEWQHWPTPREVVGRALKELEVAGALEMRQGCAVVLSRERLRLLVSGEQ